VLQERLLSQKTVSRQSRMGLEVLGLAMIDDVKMHKTVCMLCFQVCGINAYVKDGALPKVEGMKEHPFSRGCSAPEDRDWRVSCIPKTG
jgi:anaerobic selenocysteine-containing dehydrogenase